MKFDLDFTIKETLYNICIETQDYEDYYIYEDYCIKELVEFLEHDNEFPGLVKEEYLLHMED